ncbi:MAG: hypothetical protein Q8O32_00795 [bacterium]|nr:hypothetical protein [bacterium]
MFWQKVEHNLKLSFLLLLVFTQALVFVAVSAKDDSKLIEVSLVNPIPGQTINAGDFIDWEAYLTNEDAVNFSSVYFTIENPNISYAQNFEANKSTSNTWKASSSWDTSNLPTGYYWLTVQADVYSNDQLENYYSDGQLFLVQGVDYQMAANTAIGANVVFASPTEKQVITEDTFDILVNSNVALSNVAFNIKVWNETEQSVGELLMPNIIASDFGEAFSWGLSLDISSLENGYYIIFVSADLKTNIIDPLASGDSQSITGEVVFSINRPPEISAILGTINSPMPNQNIKAEFLAKTTLNRPLDLTSGEKQVILKISDSNSKPLSQTNLASSDNSGLVYQKTINSAFLGMDGEPLYPDGNYKCEFFVSNDEATNSINTSLGSANIFVDNEPDELELAEQVVLNSPAIGSVISDDSFVVDISTLTPFSALKIQFYQQADPAIASENIDIPLVDGYHWIQTLSLDDSFVDGDYILSLTFYEQGTSALFGALDYQLKLSRQGEKNNIDPDNITIKLLNLESNISGVESPVVLSNFEFSSGDISLAVSKSADNTELGQVALIRASWSTLASLGFYQGDYNDTAYGYLASWDTSDFANGNYNVVAKSNLNSRITSETKLLSIFNTPNGGAEEDNNIIGETEIIEEEMPAIDGELEETELINEPLGQNDNLEVAEVAVQGEIAIYLYDSCLDLGIDNENDCLHFRAMAESLDKRCISQSIFETVACEDYLNRLEVDLECQAESIIEREECQDYLLEKYASNVNCQLADNSACNDVLRNSYLNRLVIAQKNQIAINQFLLPLIGTSVSTQELSDKAESLGLDKETLSIGANIETKVFLAKAQPEAVLEDKDVLTMLGQAVMLLDSDGDFLPDDLESYYGTDKNNPDSDGDAYSDSTEIQNNYNPLGDGALSLERLTLEKVLLGKVPLEQPKSQSEKIDSNLDLTGLENLENRLRLRGQAEANTWLTIYLYSDLPLLMLTKTDESGNWSYDITQTITDGYHQVYVASNDSNGKIIKQSRPVSFLVKNAQAVTADDYFGQVINLEEPKSFLIYYMSAGALLILVILSAVMFWRKNKNRPRRI